MSIELDNLVSSERPFQTFGHYNKTLERLNFMWGPLEISEILNVVHAGILETHESISHSSSPETTRGACRVLISLQLSFLLTLAFLWIHYCLRHTLLFSAIASAVVFLLSTLLLAFSPRLRCIVAVSLSCLAAPGGRVALLLFASAVLLRGPVVNMYSNLDDVARSMGCSAELQVNQTSSLRRPFDSMIDRLNDVIIDLQESSKSVSDGLTPVEAGLGMIGTNVDNGYLQLMGHKRTCRGHIERTFNSCRTGVLQAQKQCHGVIDALNNVSTYAREILKKIPWPAKKPIVSSTGRQATPPSDDNSTLGRQQDICLPLDPDRICLNLNHSDSLCQPTDWAGEAIKQSVSETRTAMTSLRRAIQFNITSPKLEKRGGTASQKGRSNESSMSHRDDPIDFRSTTIYFEIVTLTLSIVIYVISGAVLFGTAHRYVKNYLSSDDFDNRYVTHHLKDIDVDYAQRFSRRALLPLTKFERTNLRSASPLSSSEGCFVGLTAIVLSLALSVTAAMFDYALFWVLNIMTTVGRPSFDVTGRESLEMVVVGEGVIVDFLDVFLKGFHPQSGLNGPADARVCLPTPHPPSTILLTLLTVVHFVLFLSIVLNRPMLRLRNCMTGYFYPHRERARSAHLYRMIACRRLRLGELLRAAAKRNYCHRVQWERMSYCHAVVGKWTRGSGGVGFYGRCIVCDSDGVEERHAAAGGALITCDTDGCTAVYCGTCYAAMQRICAICQPDLNTSTWTNIS